MRGPADTGPGSEGSDAKLRRAHEEGQARPSRELAAYNASHPNYERQVLVALIRETIDERLAELGIETSHGNGLEVSA